MDNPAHKKSKKRPFALMVLASLCILLFVAAVIAGVLCCRAEKYLHQQTDAEISRLLRSIPLLSSTAQKLQIEDSANRYLSAYQLLDDWENEGYFLMNEMYKSGRIRTTAATLAPDYPKRYKRETNRLITGFYNYEHCLERMIMYPQDFPAYQELFKNWKIPEFMSRAGEWYELNETAVSSENADFIQLYIDFVNYMLSDTELMDSIMQADIAY